MQRPHSRDSSAQRHTRERPAEQERPAHAHDTEVLVCRPRRKRKQPEWLVPPEALRACATGSRKRKRPAGECGCDKPACAADRAERDEMREQLAREAAAHAQLREELGALARAASDGGAEEGAAASLAAAAMQQALLAILDGEENEADALV